MNNAASLTKMKKDELVELCKQKGLTGYSKLKKDELVALLSEAMGAGAQAAPSAAPEQAEAAEKTAGAAAAPRAEASGTAGSALGRYCTALVNLWGIAPAAMVAAVYNQFTGSSVTAEDVEAAASCPVVNGELIHKNLADRDDEIAALRKKQAHYNHYLPSANHIDDYLDERYRENTHEFIAMRDFMVRSFHMKEALATANALHILQYLDTETDVSYLMSQLATAGVRFENDQQFRNFAVLLNRMKSTARFWGFCGHTPEEAENFAPKRGTVHVYKVGRNDPCPCGSGKKYKKCCGR